MAVKLLGVARLLLENYKLVFRGKTQFEKLFRWKRYKKMYLRHDIYSQKNLFCFLTACYWHWYPMWRHNTVVITTAHLHSTKSELRFFTGSNPACGMSEIGNGENQWFQLKIMLNVFRRSMTLKKQFSIIIIIKIHFPIVKNEICFLLIFIL